MLDQYFEARNNAGLRKFVGEVKDVESIGSIVGNGSVFGVRDDAW